MNNGMCFLNENKEVCGVPVGLCWYSTEGGENTKTCDPVNIITDRWYIRLWTWTFVDVDVLCKYMLPLSD